MTPVEPAGPLIGRAREWKILREALDAVHAGASRQIFIGGEAGIGKTRLVEELVQQAARGGLAVLSGAAEELEHGRPFGAISDVLLRSDTSLPPTSETLRSLLQSGSAGQTPTDAALVDTLIDLLEELALSTPTVVAIEDLHWADPVTIAAIRAVGRRLTYLPLLIVGTYRPYPRSRQLSRLLDAATRQGAVEISLEPLEGTDVDALTSALVDATPGSGLRTVMRAAGGNPLYLTEIARALSQDGVLRIGDGVADVASPQLPPTLRLTILRRISFLPPATLELLRTSAVLGSAFGIDELAGVTGSAAAELVKILTPAIDAAIVEERPGGLRFRHDLIQEAIYQDIPAPIRSTMHVDVSRTLRSLGTPPPRVAEHVLRGLDLGVPELFDEAVGLANELRQASPGLAVALYEKAVQLPGVPEDRREFARANSIYPLMTIGRIDDAQRLSDHTLKHVSDPSVRAFSTWPILEAKMRTGRTAECIPVLESLANQEGLADYHRGIIRTIAVVAHARTSDIASVAQVAEELHANVHEGVTDLRPLEATSTVGSRDFQIAATSIGLSAVRMAQGEPAEGMQLAAQAIEVDTRTPTPIPIIFTLLAMAQIEVDEFAEARESCVRGRRRDAAIGDTTHPAPYSSLESLVMFLGGDWDGACVEARSAIDLVADGTGSADLIVGAHMALSQIALRRGDVGQSSQLVADMERFMEERGPQWGMQAIEWSRATLLEARGDSPAAFRALASAWDAWPDRHLFGRHTFADLVRLALEHGDRERAEGVTQEVERVHRSTSEVPSARGVH